jgi:hypothetical protein
MPERPAPPGVASSFAVTTGATPAGGSAASRGVSGALAPLRPLSLRRSRHGAQRGPARKAARTETDARPPLTDTVARDAAVATGGP